jgi:hypothetical protein
MDSGFRALANAFHITWCAAVISSPAHAHNLLRIYADFGLVKKWKNGRVKLELTPLGASIIKATQTSVSQP